MNKKPSLCSFQGNVVRFNLYSSGRELRVHFHTDSTVNTNLGYRLAYRQCMYDFERKISCSQATHTTSATETTATMTAPITGPTTSSFACQHFYNTTFGEFTSPNYPNDLYPPNMQCSYVIEAPKHFVVQLRIIANLSADSTIETYGGECGILSGRLPG